MSYKARSRPRSSERAIAMRSPAQEEFFSARFDRRQLLRGAAVGLCFTSRLGRFAFGQENGGNGDLIFHQRDPLNAEPPLGLLPREFITPNKNFYIRNHGSMPNVD